MMVGKDKSSSLGTRVREQAGSANAYTLASPVSASGAASKPPLPGSGTLPKTDKPGYKPDTTSPPLLEHWPESVKNSGLTRLTDNRK